MLLPFYFDQGTDKRKDFETAQNDIANSLTSLSDSYKIPAIINRRIYYVR